MQTLVDFVRLNARRNADALAVVDESNRLTHSQLTSRAWALAQGLIRQGVQPGDRVAVMTRNSIFAIETYLGVVCAGAVYVPFNWRWATPEIIHAIELVDPALVLVETQCLDDFEQARPSLPQSVAAFTQGPEYEGLFATAEEPSVAVRPDDPAVVLFTGGTTGFSKGVVVPHRAVVCNALNEIVDLGFGGPRQVGLAVVPLHHSASLLCVFGPHYISGGATVTMRKFTEDDFVRVVAAEGVTSTFIIPNMIRRLLAHGAFTSKEMGTLRQLHTGGGNFQLPDKLAIKEARPDLELNYRYGLTEAGPMVSRLKDEDILNPALDGSIGQEYLLAEVQVRGADGLEVSPGELGEIVVRGPGVMLGYFRQPEATEDVLVDGWLRTGDLAVRDEEGYLYFRDRAKDMIKSGGENVYAAEIEQLLYAHPAVLECGVLGVESAEWGEEVRAVVCLREGFTADSSALDQYLRDHLAGYKVPKQFLFVPQGWMPINPSGKVVKSQIREQAGW